MKFNFTFSKMYEPKYVLVFIFLLFSTFMRAQATKIFATSVASSSNADQLQDAVDGNLTTSSAVRASSGLALGIGAYAGYIELQYPALVPANTTSYIKIQTDDNLLPSLLGGSLGGLLSDVAGGLLIGNQEFTVQAKNGNVILLQGDSQDNGEFATERLRIVTDQSGAFYIAITPNAPYDRIRLRNRLGSAVGLFNTKVLRVFESYYLSGTENCGYASYTSFSGSGLNLDLLGLGGAGVTNPQFVLDADPNSFSRLSLGIISVAGSIQQTVYFDGLSQPTEEFNIRLKVDPSLLALGLANNIQVIAFDGPSLVETRSISSLLNLDLLTLQGGQIANIPFAPIAPVDRITIRYSSLLNVQLTQSLDLYDVVRVPKVPQITAPSGQGATICSGSAATINATTAAGNEIRYYTSPIGGTPITTVALGVPYQTQNLTANTTFYVAAAKIGCTEESRRVPIPITVIATPTAADIAIPAALTACQGAITLNPTSAIAGATIKYYKDQNKTQEIDTGFAGDAGVTYVKNQTNGSLTITGLSVANSPYTYYVSLTVNGLCENNASTLKEVTVTVGSTLSVPVNPNLTGCGSVNLASAILNFDPSATYIFYNAESVPITTAAASNITVSGTYFIQQQNASSTCISELVPVTVTVSTQPTLVIPTPALVTQIGNSVTLNATSSGTITWFGPSGTALPSNNTGPFTAAGTFTYTAVATLGTCSVSGTVTVTVIDPANCPALTERNFADSQRFGSILTGGVFNAANAVDSNLQSFSTITTGLGLLGIGTTFQILEWNETIPAGTPVTLKLGSEYSGLTLIGGYSVVGTKRNASGIPVDVGVLQNVSGSLLNLLPGQNNFEYTFVPTNNAGPQAYDGVRIQVASLVSIAQNAKVYEAYYEVPAAQIACGPDAEDVLFGAVDLGIGALTTTVGVSNAFNAIDTSDASFATLFTGVGVLAAAELTAVFRTPSIVGDTIKIRISQPANLLNLNALSGLSFQPILNNANAGPALTSSALLNLEILGGGSEAILTFVPTQSLDRLRIRLGGAANVLDQIRVHYIKRTANTKVENSDDNNAITVCQGGTISLQAPSVSCTSYIWYDAETGGNVVSIGNSFTLPTALVPGTYNYYIQPVRFGCETFERGRVTVTVMPTAPSDAISSVQINGGTATSLCVPDGNVTLNAIINSASAVTNPIFYWYFLDGTTQELIPNQSDSSLELTGLAAGTYTYFVGVSASEFCQTAPSNRFPITFTILPSSVAADIVIGSQTVCLNSTALIAPSSTLTNPVFTYYFTNDTSQPISSGTFNGITYVFNADGTLSISGLIAANSPYTYFIAVNSATTCLNVAGSLKPVTVTVGNPPAPTTENASQTFCSQNNPTIADIQVNQSNVVFYNVPVGGSPLSPTDLLTAGTYYAAIIDGDCESDIRLAITIIIGNPPAPTTPELTQNFCQINNPTVADIQVNEANVVFYTSSTGGTALLSTDILTAGLYYAAIQDGACQSLARLEITIIINNPSTPTTDNASQNFCAANNPTIADLEINEANVLVYNLASGGTPLDPAQPLTNGTYYISQLDGGCESIGRLAITVAITTVGTPSAVATTQNFCQINNPTVADIEVNEPGVIFYDAPSGGNVISSGAPLASSTYYAALAVGSCESEARLAITVTVSNPSAPTAPSTTQAFCQSESPTVADLDINETAVAVYTTASGGSTLFPTDALASGTYYVALLDGGCESSTRLAITVTVSNPAPPTTSAAEQAFCLADGPTVADLEVNETGAVFYSAASGGTPLAATDALTNGTYYAALLDATGCESATRLAIVVSITVVGNATADSTTQNFCQINNPTVADIEVNQTGVIFYDAPSGGNVIPSGTPLASGTYYAALAVGSCESEARLAITVTVSNPSAPTAPSTSQSFCQSESPTVADLDINESAVAVYTTESGGTPLLPTDALASGTYYVALLDGGCESSTRLAINVTVSNPAPPTTSAAAQAFCLADGPTVADLEVNETGVVFYSAASGGTPLAPTDALTNGTYYAALVDGNGCESATRLAITVSITVVGNATADSTVQNFCQQDNPTVADIEVNEPGVIFYDAPSGGNVISSGAPLASGTYYAALAVGTCESEARLAITVTVSNPSVPTAPSTAQSFCQSDSPTVADLDINETAVAVYTTSTGGTPLLPMDALASGTYYVALLDGGCESSTRLAITVTVSNPAPPTTNSSEQAFCLADGPTVADLEVNETGVVFYSAASGGTPLAPTDALTNGTYYAAIVDATGCESATRLAITVSITVVGNATADSTAQNFCQQDNPTAADIEVNEQGVIFYDAPSGGNVISSGTPLASGTYYAALAAGSCESEARLAITVTVSNPSAPTAPSTTQSFCQSDSPTVSDLDINETAVAVYTTASGGTPLLPTDALASGTYYVSLLDGGCESGTRLAINVTVSNPAPPTTSDVSQAFCLADGPTVADLEVNETGVVFYSAASGGTPLAPTDALTNGTYYAAIIDATGCESATRLAIVVSITVVGNATADSTAQNFCQQDNPTVADIEVNEPGVIFYDSPSGGNVISSGAPLASGTYYAALAVGSCESEARLTITVTVSNPSAPTSQSTAQSFCQSDSPTVADLDINETAVSVYTTASGGTALLPTDALASGTYYVALLDGGCESSTRLAITVTVTSVPLATTTDNAQAFCQSDNPVISDIQVNETNVVFYTAPVGGTPLAANTPLVQGTYYVALSNGTCESNTRLAITVSFLQDGLAEITGGGAQACVSETVTYTTLPGMTDYLWSVTGATLVAGGQPTDNFITVTWVATGTISVSFVNTSGCSSDNAATREVAVSVCSDITITKTVDNPAPSIDDNVTFTITVSNTGQSNFTDIIVSEPLPSGYQYLSSSSSVGTYSPILGTWSITTLASGQTATLEIVVRVLALGEYMNIATLETSNPIDSNGENNVAWATVEPRCLIVYNEFSPNNDGNNDLFRIDCIENYPNNALKVYNRYGVEVYQSKGYQNNWDGTANVNSPINQDNKLPTGTYYYVLDLGDGSATKTGWVYIIR